MTTTLSVRIDYTLAVAGVGETHVVTAAAEDAGLRLDRFLAARLNYSRSRIKSLIESGCLRAEATITEPSRRVKPGEVFTLAVPAPEPARPAAEDIALNIVHEDAALIVIDKPAGLVVHPAPGHQTGTLVNALIAHCGDSLSGIGGVRRPGIVHRLDKDTSGLMVVAKTDAAHAHLSAQWHARTVERQYLALAWGVPSPRAGTISGAIRRSPRVRTKMAVVARGGRASATRYRVQRALRDVASVLECRLATGRTHQVRVHLAHIGHPVIGDPVYGGGLTAARRRAAGDTASALIGALHRQALHAATLGFIHPTTGAALSFTSSLPEELALVAAALELH
jgi:23S rRNA pseudouridine1911/1915/1917 synthase